MMNHIAVNPIVIAVTIAEIKEDIRAHLGSMSTEHEAFFDFMVGAPIDKPSIPLIQQLDVARSFLEVIDGFPVASSFDWSTFPAFTIARNTCREWTKLTEQRVHGRGGSRGRSIRRKATRPR